MAAGMPLLPSALPPKGEASRYGANIFLNLIALLRQPGVLCAFTTDMAQRIRLIRKDRRQSHFRCPYDVAVTDVCDLALFELFDAVFQRKHRLNRYQISFLDFYTERGDIRRE